MGDDDEIPDPDRVCCEPPRSRYFLEKVLRWWAVDEPERPPERVDPLVADGRPFPF